MGRDPDPDSVQLLRRDGGLGVGFDQRWSTFDQAFHDAAQQAGFPSWVYTINDVDEMQAALDVGVDGIETDYPQRLIELIEAAE